MQIDISEMTPEALLKIYEIQWEDHFQARKQTWQALQIAGILCVALVGIQWKSGNPLIICITSAMLIAVSYFGMQITIRHRNSVEITKFSILSEIEKKIGFKSYDLNIPTPIKWQDIFKLKKSNTSLFLLRMQSVIFLLGWLLLILGILEQFK